MSPGFAYRFFTTSTSIKTVCYWHKNKHRNKIESPEITPHISGQLIFDKGAKNGEKLTSIVNGVGKL